MLYGALISTIFGATIPGSVYVSQSFRFRRPVFVGDGVVARVEVTAVRAAPRHLVTCATTVRRSGGDGRVCLEGEAVVMLPPVPAAVGVAAAAGRGSGSGAADEALR